MNTAAYDALDHLCDALFLRSGDLIIPLTVYFDASGSDPDKDVWAIGGWIAEVDQWKQFCKLWQPMLDRAPFRPDVKRMFHAAELESLQGIYSDWSDTDKQKFQNEAYSIIEGLHLFPIASAVVKQDFEDLKIRFENLKQGHGANYFIHTFHDVMKNVHNWLEDQHHECTVQYVFEWGDLGDGRIKLILDQILNDPEERKFFRMRGWTMTGKDLLPLQAADIWAYEAYKMMINVIIPTPKLHPIRYPWRRLYRPAYHKYQTLWDRENLPELLKKYREIE